MRRNAGLIIHLYPRIPDALVIPWGIGLQPASSIWPESPLNAKRTVELFLQEGRSKRRLAAPAFSVTELPKVGQKLSLDGRNFLVKQITHIVLRRGRKKAARGVVLSVDDLDALTW